jgi:hypothetical protein
MMRAAHGRGGRSPARLIVGAAAAAAVALAAIPTARAQSQAVLVLPASGANVSASLIRAARALLVARLSEHRKVIDMDRPPTPVPPPLGEALARAMALSAAEVLLLQVTRQGGWTTITGTLVAVPSGQLVRNAAEHTAAGPEIMPRMIDGVANQLFGIAPSAPASTPAETAAPSVACPDPDGPGERRRTLSLGVRFGAAYARETPRGHAEGMPVASVFVVADAVRYMGDLSLQFASVDRDWATSFAAGFYLPFSESDHSVYYGLQAGWSSQHLGGQGASGFAVAPVVGLAAWRFSRFKARLEASYRYNLFEEKEEDRLIPDSGAGHTGHGPQITLGVAF